MEIILSNENRKVNSINILLPNNSYSKFESNLLFEVEPSTKEVLLQVPCINSSTGLKIFLLVEYDTQKELKVITIKDKKPLDGIDITIKLNLVYNANKIELTAEKYILNEKYSNHDLELSEVEDTSKFNINVLCNDRSIYLQEYKPNNFNLLVLYIAFDIGCNNSTFDYFGSHLIETLKKVDLKNTIIRLVTFGGNNNPSFFITDRISRTYHFINDLDFIKNDFIATIGNHIGEVGELNNESPLKLIWESISHIKLNNTVNTYSCRLEKRILFYNNKNFFETPDFLNLYNNLSNNTKMFSISHSNEINNLAILKNVNTIADFFQGFSRDTQKNRPRLEDATHHNNTNKEHSKVKNKKPSNDGDIIINTTSISRNNNNNNSKPKSKVRTIPMLLILMVLGFSIFKNAKDDNSQKDVEVYNSVINSTEKVDEIKEISTTKDTTDTSIITTTTPIVTTTKSITTITTPIVTTTKPIVTTTKSITTITTPIVTTTKPIVTTTKPIITTIASIVTTTKPIITTTAPVITTVTPITTTPIITSTIQDVVEPSKDDFIYDTHNAGTVCIIKYIGHDTAIRLPNYIDDLPVTSMISTAFQENNNITKFIFNDNMEEIITDTSSELQCFDGFKDLKMVYFGKSIKYITEDYFDYCSSLRTIVVNSDNPYYSTDNGLLYSKDMSKFILCPQNYPDEKFTLPDATKIIEDHCFEECTNIKTLDLNNAIQIGNMNFIGTKVIMRGDSLLSSELELPNVSTIMFTTAPSQQNLDYCKSKNIGYFVK